MRVTAVLPIAAGLALAVPGTSQCEDARNAPTVVSVGIDIIDIVDIDESNETCTLDLYLWAEWQDPAVEVGDKSIHVLTESEIESLWKPRLEYNVHRTLEVHDEAYIIQGDGKVEYSVRMVAAFYQSQNAPNFFVFPFDSHVMTIEIGSFTFPQSVVVFQPLAEYGNGGLSEIDNDVKSPSWLISGWKAHSTTQEFPIDPAAGDPTYSNCVFQFSVHRRVGHYIWRVVLPLLAVLAIAVSSIFVGRRSIDGQLQIIGMSLVALVALHFSVSSNLPELAYPTLLDLAFLFAYGLVVAIGGWCIYTNPPLGIRRVITQTEKTAR